MNRGSELAAGGPATFGMRLLLASLTVLFLAGLIGYWITRQRLGPDVVVTVPSLLFGSTIALIITGMLIDGAWRRIRRSAVQPARVLLRMSVMTALVFLALQVPALLQLLTGHRDAVAAGNPLLGFAFFLILLHALHVLGGLIALAALTLATLKRPLVPDEDGAFLRLSSRYWHFLDVVWVVMFAVFLLV